MKTITILLLAVLVLIVVAVKICIFKLLSSTRRKITHTDIGYERQQCKKYQGVFIGGLLGFSVVFVVVLFSLPSIWFGYQVVLGMAGLILGMLIGVVTN